MTGVVSVLFVKVCMEDVSTATPTEGVMFKVGGGLAYAVSIHCDPLPSSAYVTAPSVGVSVSCPDGSTQPHVVLAVSTVLELTKLSPTTTSLPLMPTLPVVVASVTSEEGVMRVGVGAACTITAAEESFTAVMGRPTPHPFTPRDPPFARNTHDVAVPKMSAEYTMQNL
jgi:hypothetical protein